jgi:hypothetical protein
MKKEYGDGKVVLTREEDDSCQLSFSEISLNDRQSMIDTIDTLMTALSQAQRELIQERTQEEKEIGIRLYYLEEGDDRIPVITDNPAWIRSDVGSEDHGGMDWDDFCRVCEKGEIKQVTGEADLPPDLMNAYCYSGGNVGWVDLTCRQLCEQMEDGVIILEGY